MVGPRKVHHFDILDPASDHMLAPKILRLKRTPPSIASHLCNIV